MKKILFLIPNLMHGGAEKVLVNLVNNLDPSKYEITLFSIFDQGVNKEFLNQNINYQYKFKKVFRGNSQLMKLFSPKFLYRFFIKEEYDILVSYLEGPTARIISGCTQPKTKKIAWIHIELNDHKKASVGFRNWNEAVRAYEKYDKIIGVSENVVACFKKNMTDRIPSQVLYNTNETVLIKELSQEAIDIEFNKNVINICSVAKIVKTKGFDRLLIAHRKLLDEGFPHCINILGVGEESTNLERKIKELKVQNSFKLLGFHKNPYKYMSKCDLYVCSSHVEGFSTAVSEALILGIPVVSTNCSGAYELLGRHNDYGIVTENSTEALYDGIKEMLGDPDKLLFYKQQAAIRGGFFSKENTVEAVEKLLDELQ